MFRRFSVNFALLSVFFDAVLVTVGLLSATLLRGPLGALPFVYPLALVTVPLFLYLAFPIAWVVMLLVFDVYDGRKNFRFVDELSNLTLGSLLAAVSLAGLLYIAARDVSRFLFLTAVGLGFLNLLAWRIAARLAFRKNGLHSQVRKVMILGGGALGQQVAQQISAQPAVGLELVGFLNGGRGRVEHSPEVLGSLEQARSIVIDRGINDVIIALPAGDHARVESIVCDLQDLPVHIWIIPDQIALAMHRARVEEFSGVLMFDLRAPALNDYQRMAKRAFDLVITLLVMPIALPVMGLVSLVVRLDSPGPILFRTHRMGENGGIFAMYKFRTMIAGADQMKTVFTPDENGVIHHKNADDPRVTRAGKILRKLSLDELPQLFNVLRGDMSLVGPRPELPELVQRYNTWQRERFAVPQGMTGWWQVNGRSDKPLHLNTEEDLYYVRNYSIWLDVKILVKTIWVVLRGKGAY